MVAVKGMHFEKNMVLLKANHPDAFKLVSGDDGPVTGTEFVLTGKKKPNLKAKNPENEWVFIHNQEDPGSETEVFLSMIEENSTGVGIMFGMGLGYSVFELLKKRKKLRYMIVFELNVEFFIHAMGQMDLTEVLTDKRVVLCIGEPGELKYLMAPVNKALMLEDIHTLNLQNCFRVNHAYDKLSTMVFDYISAYNIEGATKATYGRTFFENRLKHLTSMHHDKKLEDLAGRFKGVPALIIAAGPSLDKNIDHIVKAIGKAVIIAVDSALPSLIAHGIVPDFVTSIDYQELTYEKISGSASDPAATQVNLICTSWVASTVSKTFPAKNVFWAFSNNAFENWINTSLGGKISIGGAGTVAHLNFISANIMGCDPVIFVGQDLAFTGSREHSSNVVLTREKATKKMVESGQDIMWVKGLVEPKVPTNRQLYGFKHIFERMIKESSGKVINATEGGLFIEGAETMPLALVIDRHCKSRVNIDVNGSQGQASPVESIKSTLEHIKKLEKIIFKADKMAEPLRKKFVSLKKTPKRYPDFSSLPETLKKKISLLDQCHNRADENQLWSFFDEMTMEGLKQNEREKQAIEGLSGHSDRYLEWLSRSLDRIDTVNKIRMTNLGWFKDQLNGLVSFYNSEKLQLGRIEDAGTKLNGIHKLAELYYGSGNYALLEKMIDKCVSDIKGSAAFHYYHGVIALYRGDYETAENEFQSAVIGDGIFAEKIAKKRNEIGDYYLKLANYSNGPSGVGFNTVVGFLLLKGLKSCPEHIAIQNEFRRYAKDAQIKSKQLFEEKKSDLSIDLLETWIDFIQIEGVVNDCLDKETLYGLYLFYGQVLMNEKEYNKALQNYQYTLSIRSDNPEVYLTLADICFTLEDFDSGVQYLSTAVGLDKNYAVYWCNMGKNLQSQKDYTGAIVAYEQCFIALPENIVALKEIGDCHTKLGNLEAAREAYQQFKKLGLKNQG